METGGFKNKLRFYIWVIYLYAPILMSQRGTLFIMLVQNRHNFKIGSLEWLIVELETWPSILFAYMSELALPRCLPSGSRHLVSSTVLTAGAEGKHSENKWRQLLLSSRCTFPRHRGDQSFVLARSQRDDSRANWIYEQNTVTPNATLLIWGNGTYSAFTRGKVRAAYVFPPFSSSNKPPDLQSFMQVKEDQE